MPSLFTVDAALMQVHMLGKTHISGMMSSYNMFAILKSVFVTLPSWIVVELNLKQIPL